MIMTMMKNTAKAIITKRKAFFLIYLIDILRERDQTPLNFKTPNQQMMI
jgi:hypothetical protein